MITIPRRNYDTHIKSLLHFDYPYYAEDGDGLADEAGLFTWTRTGGAELAGTQPPADRIISGTPKWGWRCLNTAGNSQYIAGTYSTGLTLTKLEASFWIRVTSSSAGNIFTFGTGTSNSFVLSLNSSLTMTAYSSGMGLNAASSQALALNTWTHVRFRLNSAGKEYTFMINNEVKGTGTFTGTLPKFTSMHLGGFTGQLDEFMLRDTESLGLPSGPEQAVCSLQEFGGWGTGAQGSVTISSSCVLNTCGTWSKTKSASSFTLKSVKNGYLGGFKAGDEIMVISRETGEYCFRTCASYASSTLTLNSAPSFAGNSGTLFVQVPNFSALHVNANVVVSACSAGVIAFRCKGNCNITGKLISMGFGTKRTDYIQMTHALLSERFLFGEGGGIFMTCGGIFWTASTARIGADWAGTLGAGTSSSKSAGGNGGAGYGGGGGTAPDSNGLGGKGGVGGGGGAGDKYTGGDAGMTGTTGGYGRSQSGKQHPGGTQGKDAGGNAPDQSTNQESGGGGAGGSGGKVPKTSGSIQGGRCGASIILICQTLRADTQSFSTGGEGGLSSSPSATGGGGTGFCYIACDKAG